MDIMEMLDRLRSAYDTLDHPDISGLKTIHQKTPVSAAIQAEFDAALSRIDREGRPARPYPQRPSKAA
jgi:hypothetical protein